MAPPVGGSNASDGSSAPYCPIEARYISDKERTNSSCSSSQTAGSNIPIIPESAMRHLGDKRTESSIPGKASKWIYPSERQFYRSTLAKGHHVDSRLVPTVVQIHNAINEKAWEKLMEYEDMHLERCTRPVLAHFIGKKDELSLRARWNNLMGYKLPYDRHDWTVDRCGKLVRYLIPCLISWSSAGTL